MRAILTYHSIDDSGSAVSVSPRQFEAHCRFLSRGSIRVVSLQELVDQPASSEALAITFDDGFENFLTTAWPQLEAHGLPVTVFAVPDKVGRHNDWGGVRAEGIPHLPLMGWDALGHLSERGCEIGAHTLSHPRLSTIDVRTAEQEISGSVDEIQRRLGVRVRAFAYPYGDAPRAAASHVSRLGLTGCTTELRPLRAGDDRARLPRLDAYYLRDAGRLESYGTPGFRARLWLRARARDLRSSLSRNTQSAALAGYAA